MAVYSNVKLKAYGKLNLLLDIVGVRRDGYHMLNTVMQSIDQFDTLEISLSDGEGLEIVCDKEDFPTDSSNLIWKAAKAFKQYTKTEFGGKITVTVDKKLPSMAGMAGGSADCAAMLHGLNMMFGTLLDDEELCEIGVKLGADVPFCIMGGTRLCQGIGEITNRIPSPQCTFVVVKPEVSISTPEAFKKYDSIKNPERAKLDNFLKAMASGKLLSQCIYMFNVLEYASQNPEISAAKEKLKSCGALTSLMTGSGSAVFGVFFDEKSAVQACETLKADYRYCKVCKPVKKGWDIISTQR